MSLSLKKQKQKKYPSLSLDIWMSIYTVSREWIEFSRRFECPWSKKAKKKNVRLSLWVSESRCSRPSLWMSISMVSREPLEKLFKISKQLPQTSNTSEVSNLRHVVTVIIWLHTKYYHNYYSWNKLRTRPLFIFSNESEVCHRSVSLCILIFLIF